MEALLNIFNSIRAHNPALPAWYTDESKRQASTKENFVVIARNSLSVVKEIIQAGGTDPTRVL